MSQCLLMLLSALLKRPKTSHYIKTSQVFGPGFCFAISNLYIYVFYIRISLLRILLLFDIYLLLPIW